MAIIGYLETSFTQQVAKLLLLFQATLSVRWTSTVTRFTHLALAAGKRRHQYQLACWTNYWTMGSLEGVNEWTQAKDCNVVDQCWGNKWFFELALLDFYSISIRLVFSINVKKLEKKVFDKYSRILMRRENK